ncbi:PLC-like phosphodiesterase [Xylogone sp. PMI_703]|nr:PLC-like phosphodiesterase [Xylogone sp. PMI_703]
MQPLTSNRFGVASNEHRLSRLRLSVYTCLRQTRNGARHLFPRRLAFNRNVRVSKCIFYLVIGYLLLLGLMQFFENLLDVLRVTFPDDIDWILSHWGQTGEPTEGFGHWPTDATADIHPVNCHSHNDYWRSVPLYAAVHAGCTGAEADVWLVDDELYVGHRRIALTSNRTLRNLYINPLLDLLEKQNRPVEFYPDDAYPLPLSEPIPLNGIFDVDPALTFILLIDFKSPGPVVWQKLYSQLEPLREKGYLTHFNGSAIIQRPVTVVGTGDAPFELLTANDTYRDVFFDAPLDEMADLSFRWPNPNRAQDPTRGHGQPRYDISDKDTPNSPTNIEIAPQNDPAQEISTPSGLNTADIYGPFNSYYASVSFTKSVGRVWGSRLTQQQLQLIRGQIRGAHQRGLRVRYWGLPQWPIGLRNHVWHILIREGVDMLNVDDLRHATQWDWRKRKGWWY